ncbi:MAG: hypothetical protein Q9170_004204 [Blastenia crenularia]
MDLHSQPRNVIEIMDESDDDREIQLEDFMTADELNAVLRGPLAGTPGPDHHDHGNNLEAPLTEAPPALAMVTYENCLQEVLEIFPDISREHVKKLYDERQTNGAVASTISIPQALISLILDGGTYPKERDCLNELKRKRLSEQDNDDKKAAEWKNAEHDESFYAVQARNLLQEDFLEMPRKFIDYKFKESGHLYAAYLALGLAEDTYETSGEKLYTKLKRTRRSGTTDSIHRDNMSPIGRTFQMLREELAAARTQRKKLQTQRQIEKEAADAEAAEDKQLRDSGQVMECACCFDDDVTINKITFCSAEQPHSFCFDCAATNANTQIGLSRYVLACMDSSGCKELFSRQERERFLDAKTIDKLERLQQQTELREADLPNLESCPFCDFAAICPPIEIDKEFRCSNPECEKVSCRNCRNVTHIPLSCAEFKKENGVSERHQIEEARTNAVLRKCPKCKSAIFKDGGCNKIMCSCGGTVCDYCGKDITHEKYMHFRDGPTATNIPGFRGKCPTHDNDYARNQQNMEKAEKDATEKIRKENPDLSEDDLRIKFREHVKTPPRALGPYHIPGFPDNAMLLARGAMPGHPLPPYIAVRQPHYHPQYPQAPAQVEPPPLVNPYAQQNRYVEELVQRTQQRTRQLEELLQQDQQRAQQAQRLYEDFRTRQLSPPPRPLPPPPLPHRRPGNAEANRLVPPPHIRRTAPDLPQREDAFNENMDFEQMARDMGIYPPEPRRRRPTPDEVVARRLMEERAQRRRERH